MNRQNRNTKTSSRCRRILDLANCKSNVNEGDNSNLVCKEQNENRFSEAIEAIASSSLGNVNEGDNSSLVCKEQDENRFSEAIDAIASSSLESFTHLSRTSFPIDGVSELCGVNVQDDGFISNTSLITSVSSYGTKLNNVMSPPNVPASELLDISHNNVIRPFIPEMENFTTSSSVNNILQITDDLLLTPSTQQKINFIASPTVLYINKDYDLSVSNLEGILRSIETQNNLLDAVPTEPETRITTPTDKLSRKRKVNRDLWKDNQNKKLKNSGQSYESIRSKKKNQQKSIGPPCNCKLQCYEKINEEMRMNIFTKFWNIGDHERQWDLIARYVKKEHVKRITVERKNNRTQTLIYQFPDDNDSNIRICKTMFLNTLSITQQVVYTAIEKLGDENYLKDNRGRHKNRPRKMSEETESSIIDHINLFQRVEAHYVRKDSQKEYLCETLNISKMHRLYLEWMDTNERYNVACKATKRQYETTFNSKFNLSFHKPKKDLCEVCSIYKTADNVRQEQLKVDYEKHLREKELVRQLKEEEKNNFDKMHSVVACFDLEKVLSIPQSEVGVFHYKRKYPVFNFTVYNILDKKGYCYLWHSQIAKRGAIEIASCLWSFIQLHVESGIKNISFYSDSCAGQNRNRFVFAMFAFASQKFKIKITHRFFEKGHSQSEGDSMHATIERSKKRHTIYTPDQMYSLVENAKVTEPKYQVKQMTQNNFIDFKELIKGKNWLKDINGDKIYWSKIKEVNFSHEHPHSIYFRYSFEDELREMQIIVRTNSRRRRGEPTEDPENLKLAYAELLPIPLPLHKDLISLCDSGAIPDHYQTFYRNLVPLDNSISVTNDSDGED